MGMSRHDAYYEPDYDDRSDEIEERAWELMKPGQMYDYRTSCAVAEALSEMDVEQGEALQAMIDTGDYEKIGRKIMAMSMEYHEKYAIHAAEFEINN